MTMKKNLIMGTVRGYNFYHIYRFLRSLKNVSYSGDLVLFVDKSVKDLTLKKIKECGVEVVLYKSKFPYLDDLGVKLPKSFETEEMHLYNFRHVFYYDYLSKNSTKYDYVMITDVRDVVFQQDPFEFDYGDRIAFAFEENDAKICERIINYKWISRGYGKQIADELSGFPISCAGTTIGKSERMLIYFNKMLHEISRFKDKIWCADQAAHNYLIHNNSFDNVMKMRNRKGPVMTMYGVKEFQTDRRGRLINEDGSVINVLHHYDRIPDAKKRVDRSLFLTPFHRYFMKAFYKVFG